MDTMPNPIVTITMENGDVMKVELYPDIAPNTVNNFISLVKKGFYDGLIFHRVHDPGRLSRWNRHGRTRLCDPRGICPERFPK